MSTHHQQHDQHHRGQHRGLHRGQRGSSVAPTLLAAAVSLLLLLLNGLVLLAQGSLPTSGIAHAAANSSAPAGGPTATAMAPAVPVSLSIPAIDAHSSLPGTGLNPDRTIAVPSVTTPEQAAWYTGAPQPGTVGPAIVVGHVNGAGRDGVFADLDELEPGEQILISRADRSVATFTVSRVDTVAKSNFPTRAVYGDTRGPELRRITCGGAFDPAARSYESNVIVYATLTDERASRPAVAG